jgi:aldehyde:ferredoxin oxidoreductase
VVELLRPVTGWDMDWDEGLKAGRRILTLRQAFNFREGLGPDYFRFPKRFEELVSAGPMAGHNVPFTEMRKDYFRAMGWDPQTGAPAAQTLRELGIE